MADFIDFVNFKEKAQQTGNFIISHKIPIDLETIIATYLKVKNLCNHSILLESAEDANNKGRYSAIGLYPDLIWSCDNNKATLKSHDKIIYDKKLSATDLIKSLEEFIQISTLDENQDLPAICSGIFGYMSYDMVKYFENIPPHKKDEINIPEAIFIRPQVIIVCDNLKNELIINIPIWTKNENLEQLYYDKEKLFNHVKEVINSPYPQQKKQVAKNNVKLKFSSNFSQEQYEKIVLEAKKHINAGDVFQILPSRRFYCDFPYEGFNLYRALRSLNPSPFLFYVNFADFEIIGSSPEIMVKVEEDKVTIKPLAGTRKRGKTPQEDKDLAHDLLNDEKELAEHLMLIDLGRNDIGRVAEKHSVKVTKSMEIEYYSHVMHISSTVEGKLSKDHTCLDALISGFPPGTVSGAPKIKAMEIISKFEDLSRSFYSGSVGYFSLHKNHMDMAIMLRTALLKSQTLYLQSGAGVVYDSIPEFEYNETKNKAAVLIAAAEQVAKTTP